MDDAVQEAYARYARVVLMVDYHQYDREFDADGYDQLGINRAGYDRFGQRQREGWGGNGVDIAALTREDVAWIDRQWSLTL